MSIRGRNIQRQLAIGTRVEMREHPWAGRKTAEKIAGNHIARHPYAYWRNPKK